MPETTDKTIRHHRVDKGKAENYSAIQHDVSHAAVLMDDSDVNAMSLRDSLEQRLHAFETSLVVLGSMAKTFIGPTYRHVFRSGSVEAEVTPSVVPGKIQRTMIRFSPLTVRADGIIAGSSAAGEGGNYDQEKQARHIDLTLDILQKFLQCTAKLNADLTAGFAEWPAREPSRDGCETRARSVEVGFGVVISRS